MTHMTKAGVQLELASIDVHTMQMLIDSGVISDRVELLDGVIVESSPSNNPHGRAMIRLAAAIDPALPPHLQGVGDPILDLAPNVRLAPDIAVLPANVVSEKAEGSQIDWAIEIADASVAKDLKVKAPLYAAHGVRELWVVDLPDRLLHVHREPQPEGYASIDARSWNEAVAPLVLPDLALTMSAVLDR